jgi:hypothetical protein
MRTDLLFSTFPQGQFCGNARPVENSYEFTTSLLKTLRVSNIPTKTLSICRYIFCYKLVKVYADLPRKFIRLLTYSEDIRRRKSFLLCAHCVQVWFSFSSP